jgi:hypothetical protein
MPGQKIMNREKPTVISIAPCEPGRAGASLARELALALAARGSKVCVMEPPHAHSEPEEPISEVRFSGSRSRLAAHDLPLSYHADVVCLGLDLISLNGRGTECLQGTECYDFVLVDNAPGLDRKGISLCLESESLILIISPSRSSLSRNYSLLKTLKQEGYDRVPGVLFRNARDGLDTAGLTRRFSDKCSKDFGLSLSYLGVMTENPPARGEPANSDSGVYEQKPGPGSKKIDDFVQNLAGKYLAAAKPPSPYDFWETSLASLIRSNISDILSRKHRPGPDLVDGPAKSDHDLLFDPEHPVQEEAPRAWTGPEDNQKHEHPAWPGPEKSPNHPRKNILRIGIICTDESLRTLLEDMFREKGMSPLNMMNGNHESPDILVCSLDKPDKPCLDALKKNAGIPCIWLSQYKRFSPPWTSGLRFVQILEKPFSLENIYRAVEKAALNDA